MIAISLLRKLNAELKGYGQEQIVEALADAGIELTSEDFHEGCKDMGIRVGGAHPEKGPLDDTTWSTCRQENLRRE